MTPPRRRRAAAARRSRDDSGAPLLELVIIMIVSGMLLSTVIAAVLASARLLAGAAPDTDPTVYGSLSTAVARLEASLAARQTCDNPAEARTRSDCLKVLTSGAVTVWVDPIRGQLPGTPPPSGSEDAVCWLVQDEAVSSPDKRRLECWSLNAAGVVAAARHAHAETTDALPPVPLSDAEVADLLAIDDWQPAPESSRIVTSGVAALIWDPYNGIVRGCAAIRDDQRRLMPDWDVPFCDGTVGVELAGGVSRPAASTGDWAGLEGFRLPPITFGVR